MDEELLSQSIWSLRAHTTAELTEIQMTLADTHGILFETVHRRKNGTTFPVEVSSLGATINGERMLLSVIRDITERKQSEDVLRARERELREAQRLAHIGSWHWDAKTDVTTGSDELLRIYGFNPITGLMPNFREQRGCCYPNEDWERVNEAVQKAIADGSRLRIGRACDP